MPQPSKSKRAAPAKAADTSASRKTAKRSNSEKRVRSESASTRTPSPVRPGPKKRAAKQSTARDKNSPARPGTKTARLIALLNRKEGATIGDLTKAMSWQPHSVRGAISGTLKKKLGLDVTSEKVKARGRVYRIAAAGE